MSEAREGIGRRLRLARENAGLSQAQVAKLVGVHRPTVSEMEAGRRRVAADELAVLADIYEVSVEWLSIGAGSNDPADDRLHLAARELLKLKTEDLDRVVHLIASLRRPDKQTRKV